MLATINHKKIDSNYTGGREHFGCDRVRGHRPSGRAQGEGDGHEDRGTAQTPGAVPGGRDRRRSARRRSGAQQKATATPASSERAGALLLLLLMLSCVALVLALALALALVAYC